MSTPKGPTPKGAAVAQLAERVICNLEVTGSTPVSGFLTMNKELDRVMFGGVACGYESDRVFNSVYMHLLC